jgi:hypothetical protein
MVPAFLKAFRAKVSSSHRAHKAAHVTNHGFHLAYLGAVFIEGHGLYASAAGLLFVTVVISLFFGFSEG